MKNITYRLANNNKQDIQFLYDLSIDFEKYNQSKSTRPSEHFGGDWQVYFKEEIIASLENKSSWVQIAFDENIPIGFVYYRICKDCYFFTIDELFVKEEFRKLGVGKVMLEMALSEGRKYDYEIRVEVFDWNINATEFYKRNGFEMDSVVLKLVKK